MNQQDAIEHERFLWCPTVLGLLFRSLERLLACVRVGGRRWRFLGGSGSARHGCCRLAGVLAHILLIGGTQLLQADLFILTAFEAEHYGVVSFKLDELRLLA